MERSSKRGKIPQQDWPSIIERYEKGETLASIARTYDCSPPAISYILSRSRARAAAETGSAAAPPQGEDSPAQTTRPAVPAMPAARTEEAIVAPERGDGAALRQEQSSAAADPSPLRAPAPPDGAAGNSAQNGEARRTLHLSHGYSNGPERNGAERNGPDRNGDALSGRSLDAPPFARQSAAPPPFQQPAHHPVAPLPVPGNGAPVRAMAEPQQHREGGAIDRALRERVHTDLTAFLAAFDAALADDTSESRAALREATDRLLRAGARTRIELERLEARLPLPPRDRPAAMAPSWRQR
jgi:hypothetical protein